MSILQSRRWQKRDATLTALAGITDNAGIMSGFGMTNDAGDATNDIDFAAGYGLDSTGQSLIIGAALIKRLDAAFAAGTNQGGRMSAAAIANTTYFCFALWNPASSLADFGFDVSLTAPTLPTGYTQYVHVGEILREGGVIVQFRQEVVDPNIIWRDVPINDVSTANPGTSAVTATLSVPVGLVVDAMFEGGLVDTTPGVQSNLLFTAMAQTDTAPSGSLCDLQIGAAGATVIQRTAADFSRPTNTSAQIRYRVSASNVDITVNISTLGWRTHRGRTA